MKHFLRSALCFLLFTYCCTELFSLPLLYQLELSAPRAEKIPTTLEKHGCIRVDNYYWLNQRENPKVKEYLLEENEYTRQMTTHINPLEEILFKEIRGRIKETNMTVPCKMDGYYYYTRTEEGKEYPIYCRIDNSPNAQELVLLDVNELAQGHDFCSVTNVQNSPSHNLIAYAQDTQGRNLFTVFFKDLLSNELLLETIPNITNQFVWANDNQTLFYVKQDPVTLRHFQVFAHCLGTPVSEDALVYEELDETFITIISKTKSKKYIVITSEQTLATEVRYLNAENSKSPLTLFSIRQKDHRYLVDHLDDTFYIFTNENAPNYRLMKTKENQTEKKYWQEVIPHRSDVFLQNFELFDKFLVLQERKQGLVHIHILPQETEQDDYLTFDDPTYWASLGFNPDPHSELLRFEYSSFTTPDSLYDYNMNTRQKTLLKRQEMPGGFQPENYQARRIFAKASDDVEVPISLVFRKDLFKTDRNPLLLYGYGSYGANIDPCFISPIISLLDRGFVFAIAHIRGGQELGHSWYEKGKLLKKKNTFTDFIACAETLTAAGYCDRKNMFACGGSAGGLLMGAVINMRPDLFKGVIAHVPFVDVLTTMLDPSIPLTTHEYDEWGNPENKEYYEYMASYSPYDNVKAQEYPHLLVTTGFNDSSVQYWEPAKWVAKLRMTKKGDSLLLLKTNFGAGHGGASGRFAKIRETAFDYAFLIDLVDIRESNTRSF